MAKQKQIVMENESVESRNLRYDFTAVEINELAVELANKNQELRRKEDQKKSIAAQMKSDIDLLNEQINSASTKVSSGYEYRDVKCTVFYNKPTNGMKTLVRSDNEKSFNEKMTDADYNLFNQATDENDEL